MQFLDNAPPLKPGIKPIDTSPNELPIWLTFKAVPPAIVTHEGISWLASQVGTPINKFVRDGLDIKVCFVKYVMDEIPCSLTVVLEGGEQSCISVESWEPRVYKRKEKVGYVPKVAGPQPQSLFQVWSHQAMLLNHLLMGRWHLRGITLKRLVGRGGGGGGGGGSEPETSVQVEGSPLAQVEVELSPKNVSVGNGGILVRDDEEVVYDETLPAAELPVPPLKLQ
ncbi:hypothetical protein LINPERPRIM_LOCUS31567 [Linum perenne]